MKVSLTSWVFTIFLLIADNCRAYDGPIAGNKKISECIDGGRKKFSELDITTSEYIKEQGYPAEDHVVLTEDGYLLTLNRIPGPPNASVVLLHHGFLATSFEWVLLGKNKSLAFLLADEGYDVWLGNSRGGLYSKCHVKYTTSQYKFWNFSFHEMAVYDLPAEISYIEKINGNVDKYYIGHSMGSTMAYIMAIERPDLAAKFKILLTFAPTVIMRHVRGIIPFLTPFASFAHPVVHYLLHGEIFQKSLASSIIQDFCILNRLTENICLFFRFLVFGFDFSQIDYSTVPLMVHHGFVPSAFKIAVHFSQIINSGKFRHYDYGIFGNIKAYHSIAPPYYELSRIQAPIGIIWAENDFLSTAKDVKLLYDKLSTVKLYYKVKYPKFNHLDFTHAKNVSELVNAKVISTIKSI